MNEKRIALVGGRGYTGGELLGLIAAHPGMDLAFASSTSQAGASVQEACPLWNNPRTTFMALDPDGVAGEEADAWVLAVPNGAASEWAQAIHDAHPEAVVVDLSADHRFSNTWVYGLPERYREEIASARHISNPGCYATGMQLALLPLLEEIAEPPVIFGVSGYSGAGKTPSPKNDPERLAENLMPYTLTGHVHEKEVSHQLDIDVCFTPHVAEFFRGISLTLSVVLDEETSESRLLEQFDAYYEDEPLVSVFAGIPEVAEVRDTHGAIVGGFAVDPRNPRRLVLVSVLDNLSKGAASQAMQNLNLALGLDETAGLEA